LLQGCSRQALKFKKPGSFTPIPAQKKRYLLGIFDAEQALVTLISTPNPAYLSYNFFMTQHPTLTIVPTGRTTPVGESLEQAVQKIVSALHPEKIILFGSFAYGKPTSDSDVDLLIILDTDLPPKERSWEISRLLFPRPFPVDILVKTPQEIAQAAKAGDFFICEIISRGIVLHG
jgi:hypothetical protein